MSAQEGGADGSRLGNDLDQLNIEDEAVSETKLIRKSTTEPPETNDDSDTGKTSYYTGRPTYLARREFVLETDGQDTDNAASQQPESVFLATPDDEILRLGKLPPMFNKLDLQRKHAIDIIKTTDPMSSERAIRFGYLSDQAIDLLELRERCYEAVHAAFMATDSACDDLGDLGDSTALEEPGLSSEEMPAPKAGAEAKDEPEKASYCCFIALSMAARVLEASTAREMAGRVRSGANLDDLIMNIELLKPPTKSQPWEADMPEMPGYHHVYALLGCLMATAYVRQCFAIETLYLDRAISNLDIAVLKMPDTPFIEFRQYLQEIREEIHRVQVFFQRIEMEDDPAIDSVLCAICLELKPIIGFHDTEYPYHKMDFTWVCKKAAMRCRICTLFRDSTASMYPLFEMSWPDIREMTFSNRSVGRRWFGETEDFRADVLWGQDGALKIQLVSFYLGSKEASHASYELYCSPGTPPPWKIIGTGTHVQHDVMSSETWDMIGGWIRECINDHEDCKVVSEDRPFPTRVVAVGDEDTEPHLFIPSFNDRGRYIALSHCWGDAMPLKTTRSTFAEFCHGIDFGRFPKTFQDAIVVCRKLNIEYLWIDSICIIQDDEHDWAVESPRMCDVYQNAYLTIAAAAAHNSSEGLFHPRPFSVRKTFPSASKNDDKVEQVDVFARPWSSEWHWVDSIGDGPWCRDPNPLEKRAWTLQEHVLSRRVLRFTAHELVWHCRERHLCECRPGSHERKESLRLINLDAMVAGKNPLAAPRILNPLIVWVEIIGRFTRRAITHETDRLPAVSGVAAALAAFIKTEYIAGMWKDTLGTKVCWHVEQAVTSRHETYYAPTWSWASVIGPVLTQYTFHMNQLPQTKVVDVKYTLASANPYGSVSCATLTISGILLDVSVSRIDPRPDDGLLFQIQLHDSLLLQTEMDLSVECVAFPDVFTASEETPELVLGDTIRFLILTCKMYKQGFDSMVGILLSELPAGERNSGGTVYQKIGTGEMKLGNSTGDEGEFRGTADEGLAWYMANHLEGQGCVETVTIL